MKEGRMSVKRRLGKMEAEASAISAGETADEREKRLTMTREGTEVERPSPPVRWDEDGTACS